ncbi:MAG TPA: hypothetical protein VKT77_18140 [Chthonomonadaceae bacterium]|nr:hypothetical protein [Chthonomonadaceae bacterium]
MTLPALNSASAAAATFRRPPVTAPEPATIPAVIGLAKLATMKFRGQDIMPTYRLLASRLERDQSNVAPLMDVAILDQFLGFPQRALTIQSAALQACRLFRVPCASGTPRLRLVGFCMAGPINANIPVEFLIEGSEVELILVYVVPGLPIPMPPDHDIAMVLAAESEPARPVFTALETVLARWPRPVLDLPDRVPLLGRESLYRLADGVVGVEIPATVRVDAETLAAIAAGEKPIEEALPDGGFPIIARPVDSHGGQGLERLDDPGAAQAYLTRCAVPEYYLSRFVEYRSADGQYRKYRIAVIDGVPYPSHLAISDHWMVHFLNAGMTDSEAKKAEEARFLERFEEEFAARHGAVLRELAVRSGLEYFGVDCSETRDGRLLLFEADTSLIVHNMDSPIEFPYKDRRMRRLFHAFQAMLYRRAG